MKEGEQRVYRYLQEITYLSFLIKNQASLLAATAQAAEVSELKQKLQLVDEDNIRINKRLDEAKVCFKCAIFHCISLQMLK